MANVAVIGLVLLSVLCILPELIVCPPVTEKAPEAAETSETPDEEDVVNQLAYQKYLREVMSVLMADKDFSKKVIDSGNDFASKSGEIARHLDFVGHGIRTRLDEIKRKEVDRIRQIIRLQMKLQQGTNDDGEEKGVKNLNGLNLNIPGLDKDRLLSHLDHNNPNTFEVEDLAKLIKQATTDLEEIDEKRRSEFKNYELEKEHLRKKQLEEIDDEQKRLEEQHKFEELKKKHAEHPKVLHPGAEEQLKEVWEDSDGLNKKDFDPRTFFYLHDTNGDGQLDPPEIEALFQQELDKVYDPNAPEDDMLERYEEMNRMREHVMNEIDTNKDKMVSLEEFLESTKKSDFKKDEGWETLEKQKVYTNEELAEFERQYDELRRQDDAKRVAAGDHLQGQQPLHPAAGVNVMQQQGYDIEVEKHKVVASDHKPPPPPPPPQQQQQQHVNAPVKFEPQPVHEELPDLPVHPRAAPF